MPRLLFYILISIWFISCGKTKENNTKENKLENETESIKATKNLQSDCALKFINDYVEYCNKIENVLGVIEWVNTNQSTTEKFKSELTRILGEAKKGDSELGLGFDPIFDAQDYPENGFEIESIDKTTSYLIVKGKNWDGFKLKMKIKKENDKWLIDGCGIINIPKDNQIRR